MPDSTSMFARFLLIVHRTQGVTFCRFTAESDATAKHHAILTGSGLINHPVNLTLYFID
ncbi:MULTISPECIES: hypothetical protein [unclassified Xenorhabdus]|uniref:hypothetical protein n=1 Tax=unclassified Xenorhabdus TaxID=2632833 RepID=UPI001E652794|nr:hypothetical protein [Xenorhabdus sp. PB61.4]MCC8367957.1 hypothetical protein [Xenorhabdus sp. PB61.4]